jgi:peptidoglycan hydrolase-like protein with peptidoglycan-binding domain
LISCFFALSVSAGTFAADADLVKAAQMDLIALGYDPGNIQGEMSTATIVAVSKFQAEHNMDVTGEVTPQLVGAIKAALKQKNQPAAAAASAAPAAATAQASPQEQQASLQQRQQTCLQEKYAAAQEAQKKKRGMMRLLSAVTRSSSQFGGGEMANTINQTANEVYSANATADDLSAAAKDLGLTDAEMEECRNPP